MTKLSKQFAGARATGAMVLMTLIAVGAQVGQAAMFSVDETTIAAFGTLNQNNVPPGNGANSCVPTATMNSFTFLQNAYPLIYGLDGGGAPALQGGQGSWLGAATLLASPAYMNTDVNNGTSLSDWINGKVSYLNMFAPGKTLFAGMETLSGIGRPIWDQNANPTVNFMLQELQAGEDVELGILPLTGIGHALTLTGLTWNDADNNGGFNAGDTLTLNTIDPGNPGINTPLTLSPGNPMTISGGPYNNYTLNVVLAESPIPEPATISLLLLGAVALLARRDQRKPAPQPAL